MSTSRASVRVLTILGIVIIGLLVVLLISNSSKAQSQQTTRPVEYRILGISGYYLPDTDEEGTVTSNERLNELGADGWRVVSMSLSTYNNLQVILMREIEPPTTGNAGENGNSGLVGDLDNDGDVDFADFLVFVGNFGKTLTG